ncbi:MAG TPA: peptidoglycan editing factor PgeF [Polyangiaceae bacterium]|nr:peptidoglycan editing factor PgeF [Polyangiaceae bacterium]
MDSSLYLRSELLGRAGFAHAFFTRRGGVSGGPFSSLNLSLGVGDRAEDVAENRRRAAAVLGVSAAAVCVPHQVHDRGVVVAGGAASAAQLEATAADAIVSDGPGLACAVRTADCVPLLFGDPQTRRVAAVHAGWRGVVKGVVAAAVEAMLARGSRPEQLLVAIGPHISARAFEVGAEVAAELARASGAVDAVIARDARKAHADLRAILTAQLTALDVPTRNIEALPGCTFSDAASFFSYRRDGRQSGRQLSAIVSESIIDSAAGAS